MAAEHDENEPIGEQFERTDESVRSNVDEPGQTAEARFYDDRDF